jgi:hypothetical protein
MPQKASVETRIAKKGTVRNLVQRRFLWRPRFPSALEFSSGSGDRGLRTVTRRFEFASIRG